MKAVVFHAPKDVRVQQMPQLVCGEGDLLVKSDACAVCGSDMKSYHSGNPRIKPPLILGHEFCGTIEQVGKGAAGFAVGQRVVMATTISCGQCYCCQRGWKNLCMDLAPMGFAYHGGMAEYVLIPARAVRNGHVITVPANLKPEHACLAEPVSCAVNSLSNCNLEKGDTVLVMGAGPMGLLNACVARSLGAGKIILSEVSPARLQQAEGFGCDILINPTNADLPGVVKAATDGRGVDVAIVAAPAAAPQEQAVHLVRKRGTVCLFASLPKDRCTLQMDSRAIHYNELRLVGTSDSTPEHVRTSVELMAAGKIPCDKIASHILPLEGIFEAFDLMAKGEAMRVVLKP